MATFDKDLCNKALKILRQDIEINGPDGSPLAVKCAALYDLAYDAIASAHDWREQMTGQTPEDATLKRLLVYSLAKELAIPVTGRQNDYETAVANLSAAIKEAVAKDLELSVSDESDTDLLEAFSLIRQFIVAGGALPWSWRTLKKKYEVAKESARKYVLNYFGWNFARRVLPVVSIGFGDTFRTALPPSCDRILRLYGPGKDEILSRTIRDGFIITDKPIGIIEYVEDDEEMTDWPTNLKKAYVATIAAKLALAMPNEDANKTSALAQYRDTLLSDARLADARQIHTTYRSSVSDNRYARAVRGECDLRERRHG